jgi:hypothetical protein
MLSYVIFDIVEDKWIPPALLLKNGLETYISKNKSKQ